MSWEIKSKNNEVKFTVGKVEYNDEWMQERYVSVTIESPYPIDFAIGDYLIYRDERFEINYDPGKIKSAPRFEKGDAFKYENVKFNSLADELTRCDFLDVVLGDNQLHFTGLPKFTFYGGVLSLAERIQANLDRAYGKDVWCVVVDTEFSSDTELNVSVDTIKVSGALEILVNDFKTYYTIKGRTLTIGATGVPADHLFKYGPGQGLYGIEENAEEDQRIVTRLRAYGSTRNIPHRYYNSLTDADGVKLIPDNMAVQYLMLPEFPYTTQDPYIDSPNKVALGVREDTIFFDGSGELEEIYPSIEGMTAEQLKAAGETCNATGTLDVLVSAEQMTDNGVGVLSGEGSAESGESGYVGGGSTKAEPATFKVTIKDVGFDINNHLTTETATLSFKTGMLGGRDFEIVKCTPQKSNNKIVGYELELNRVYDEDIKLWFPYKNYNAKADDKFVLLNIRMPEVYIKAASQLLKERAQAWLDKNDYSRSIYNPKIDENFMARQHDVAMASGGTIKSLHDTLCAGMQLLFEDEDLGIDAAIFIDRLTIIEGEGQIPTYEVVLKEEKTVGRLDKMQNQIDSLVAGQGQGSGGYNSSQIRSLIEAYGGSLFLSKLKDDRTPYKISSDKGFEVGNYASARSGGMFGIDANGDSFAEIAKLYVRVKAFFEELAIVKSSVLSGKQYITPGGGIKCTKVVETDETYQCYFLSEQDGEKAYTKFKSADMAICEEFNIQDGTSEKVSNRRYWRVVTSVLKDVYIDSDGNRYSILNLSKTLQEENSDIPRAGDIICHLGNLVHKDRQTAIVFSTVDADSPSVKLYSGIKTFSLEGKAVISFGCDPLSGKIFFRLGNSSALNYLDYTQDGGLQVAGSISTKSTFDGKTLGNYIDDAAQSATDAAKAELQGKIDELQNQVDGVVEAWSFPYTPTASNYPADQWTTEEEKNAHVGDVFYNIESAYNAGGTTNPDAGKAWRWSQNDSEHSGYHWHPIADSDAVRALQLAQMSVTGTDVLYKQGDSRTDYPAPLPTTNTNTGEITNPNGWSTDAPDWEEGKYIWQTTYVKKGDGSVTFSNPTCISGRNGTNVTISSQSVRYSTNHGAAQPADSTFTLNAVPTLSAGQYLWSRTEVMYSNGQPTVSYAVSRIGTDGSQGGSYAPNLLVGTEEGKLIPANGAATANYSHGYYSLDDIVDFKTGDKYALSLGNIENIIGNPTGYSARLYDINTGENISSVATLTRDNPTCVLEIIKASLSASVKLLLYAGTGGSTQGNQVRYTKPMLVKGDNPIGWSPAASEMIAPVIVSTSVTYAKSTTNVQPADSAFTATSIGDLNIGLGEYLWAKTTVTYSDNTPVTSYSVSRIGSDGNTTVAGLHIAYATGITGSLPHPTAVTDFATSMQSGKVYQYMGIYTDDQETDSTDFNDYEWAKFKGADGDNAKSVIINGEQIFEYKDNFTSASTPTSITLSATLQNTTGYQWSYKKEGATSFTNISGATSATLVVASSNTTYFPSGAKSCVFRCTSGGVYDEMTIAKVSSGKNGVDGDDGYTVLMTNESHIFKGGTQKAEAGSATCEIIAYMGATKMNATIGTITGMPTGMTVAITNNGTQSAKFTVSVTDALTKNVATSGTLNVPITVDGKVFNRTFSWSLSLEGRGITAVVEEYAIHTSGTTAPADSEFSTAIKTMTDAKPYLWNREKTTYSDNTVEPTNAICIGVKGQNGVDGATVVSVVNKYLASASASGVTTSTAGWVTDASHANATTSAEKPYLWNYEVTTWSKGNPTTTDPHVVGKYGKDGVGIDHIEEEYCLSDSSSSPTPNVWYDEEHKPTWVAGKYMWTRSHVYYTDGTDETFGEVCVTGATGTSILAEYSADGIIWHPVYQTGDIWMRTSSDNRVTWSAPIQISASNYSNNMLLKSNVPVTSSAVGIAVYELTEKPVAGEFYTFTIWGELAPTKTAFTIHNSKAGLFLDTLEKVADGVYKCSFKWKTFETEPNVDTSVRIYVAQANEPGESHIEKVKLEKGIVEDTQWTPAASEMIGTAGPWRKFQWGVTTSSTSASGIAETEWSDTPLTANPGYYVWMRSGMVVPPATVPTNWENATRLTGDKGDSGSDVYSLDMDNEMIAVPCDASGNVIGTFNPRINLKVFKGATLDSGWAFSIPNGGAVGCTAHIEDAVVSVDHITADTASVTVQATKNGMPILTSTLSLYKVIPGTDGQPAVTYSIEPSVDNITKSMDGDLSTTSVTCSVYKTTGDSTRVLTSDKTLSYLLIINGGVQDSGTLPHASGTSDAVTIPPDAEAIIFELRSGTTLLDRERIPILSDASDIEIGTRNLIPDSSQLTIAEAKTIYSATRVHPTTTFKEGEVYAFRLSGIYIYGQPTSGRFMVKIYNNDLTKTIASLTNIDATNPRGLLKITQNSGANPWLYLYAGDEETNTLLSGVNPSGVRVDFAKVSLVKGNVPLTDWTEAPEDIKKAIGKFDYLTDAMKEDTKFTGGLLLASTVSLGKNNTDYTSQETWSGINGIYKEDAVGGGISAWYGGEMYDLAEYYDWDDVEMRWIPKSNISIPGRIARGIDRMDGSGYRAGGNFWWDREGYPYFIGGGIFTGQVIAGDKQGQRIELNPNQKSVDIFGETGSRVATHSGRIIPLSEAVPPETSGPGSSKAISFNQTFISSSSDSYHYLHTYSITLAVNTPGAGVLKISVPAISLTAKTLPGQGSLSDPNAKVKGTLYLKFYNGTELVNTVGLGGITATGTEQGTAFIPARTVNEGRTVTRVVVELECYATNSKGLQGQITASAGTNMTSSFVAQWYRCEYGANGWVISYDSNNYAYMLIENGKLNFKVVSNGTTVISS